MDHLKLTATIYTQKQTDFLYTVYRLSDIFNFYSVLTGDQFDSWYIHVVWGECRSQKNSI